MIRRVQDECEMSGLLQQFSSRLGSLRSGRVSAEEMARKFAENATVLELLDGTEQRGFAAFYANDSTRRRAFLSMIAVAPDCEGGGFASLLLREVERVCRENGMVSLHLEVDRENERAIGFYRHRGFKEEPDNPGRSVKMGKSLLPAWRGGHNQSREALGVPSDSIGLELPTWIGQAQQ